MERALKNFQECGHPKATYQEMMQSPEGPAHWAALSEDWGSRSRLTQQFQRALRAEPRLGDLYKWCPEKMKNKFREEWGLCKSFQFVRESKSKTLTKKRAVSDLDEFLPEVTIASRLGGSEVPACVAMARSYAETAESLGSEWFFDNAFLKVRTYRYVRRLAETSDITEWLRPQSLEGGGITGGMPKSHWWPSWIPQASPELGASCHGSGGGPRAFPKHPPSWGASCHASPGKSTWSQATR
jgi:hypothetical protein